MRKRELVEQIMQLPGVTTEEQAEDVIEAVFHTLRDRLTHDEADDLRAQLPKAWKELWDTGSWWEKISTRVRKMNKLDRDEFIARVETQIKNSDIPAEQAIRVVFHALKVQVTPGEVADVSAQLPEDLRTLWKAA
jgi:uncharacterized protein (DUF2267 family)